jgi:hypothetical protein
MKRLILIAMVVLFSASISVAQTFCKGDFTYDGDVDANDVTTFLEHFGRSIFSNPCPPDGPAPVQKTGQTTSYYEGDDGGVEKGVEWPNPRFTDNGDGTVTDNLTGLIWLKNANCFGHRTWNEAITVCNVLANGQCGLTDGSIGGLWRLPNIRELMSLLDYGETDAPILPYGHPFTSVAPNFYWSATSDESFDPSFYARIVAMTSGTSLLELKSNSYELYVWPVRGGH